MRQIPFYLYLGLVVIAGLITVAYPPGSREVIVSVIAWWILALPWSLLLVFPLADSHSYLLVTLGKQVFGFLFVLLHAGFILLNLYLLHRLRRPSLHDTEFDRFS